MRVNRIIIKKSGILQNIDTTCSQVNLVIGDNERGKTTFLNWISKGVFEKPTKDWSVKIDDFSNVQFELESVFHQYNSNKIKTLLTFQETDLLFKYKNKEELLDHEYWNTEINSLLYGNDNISIPLQNNFLHAMGVSPKNKRNSWLIQLHNGLFDLKNTLEDCLPELDKIQNQAYGIEKLNTSLGEISQSEKEIHQKEELYFMMDKIKVGNTFLQMWDKKSGFEQSSNEYQELIDSQELLKQELTQKDDTILDIDDEISDIKLDIYKKEQKLQQVSSEPFEVYQKGLGSTAFQACLGMGLIIMGISLAFESMTSIGFTFLKGVALLSFLSGSFFLLKTGIQSLAIQKLSDSTEKNPNAIHKALIRKSQKDLDNTNKLLEQKQSDLQDFKDSTAQMRKDLKNIQIKLDTCKQDQRVHNLFHEEFAKIQADALHMFHTDDPITINDIITQLQEKIGENNPRFNYQELQQVRQEKETLLQQKSQISDKYSSNKVHIMKRVRSLVEELQNLPNTEALQHFYPEVFQLSVKQNDFSHYQILLETVEFLINKVSNDRYRAEKLVSIYNQIESNSEMLLSKVLSSNFFTYLTQNIYGGKYHRFVPVPTSEGLKISAETNNGEFYPLETLSAGAYAQFWFILKMALAKSIIKDQPGILILDDAFNSFDTVRKQYFLDAINALVHQGWQIFISITHDPQIEEYFLSMFKPSLTVINLNKN